MELELDLATVISGLTLVVLVFTLRQVAKYTRAANRQNNLKLVPLIAIEPLYTGERLVRLRLNNVGLGPAFNIRIAVWESPDWKVTFPAPAFLSPDQESDPFEPKAEEIEGHNISWKTSGNFYRFLLESEKAASSNYLDLPLVCCWHDAQGFFLKTEFLLQTKRMEKKIMDIKCKLVQGPDLCVYDQSSPKRAVKTNPP